MFKNDILRPFLNLAISEGSTMLKKFTSGLKFSCF